MNTWFFSLTPALVATLVVPLLMVAAGIFPAWWRRLPSLLTLAPLPGLIAACLWRENSALVLDPTRLHLALDLDRPRALLLGATALLWSCAGAYAGIYLRGDRYAGRFAVYWLLTLTGCLGVFFAADLVSFYLLFSLMSLAAYGLVVHDGTPAARRAAAVYLTLAVFSEAFLLIAFVLLGSATPGESLLIRDVVSALPASPHRVQTMVFLVLGFGLKMGLVPLHGWLPLAHPAAPMPASAVLSGAIIKTGVIGLVVFFPWGTLLPAWCTALTAAGLLTAFYAVLIGITQANPKTVLAYSSVSQMGLVAAVLGAGLGREGDGAALVAVFYAVHHVLVKGALFLAVGIVGKMPTVRRWPVLLPCAVLALSFAGLPFTGGMIAKLATKPFFPEGTVKLLVTLSASGSALLMLHFLRRLFSVAPPEVRRPVPAGLIVPWAVVSLAGVVLPWVVYRLTWGRMPSDLQSPGTWWEALWPVLLGGVLALVLFRWGRILPPFPEGDVICYGERIARMLMGCGARADTADAWLRRWPVAGAATLLLTLVLALLLVVGGAR